MKKGDRVALFLPNVPHMIIAYYGVLKAGAICVPTNPLYTERELTHQVKDSGSKVLVTLDLELTLSKVKALKDAAGLEQDRRGAGQRLPALPQEPPLPARQAQGARRPSRRVREYVRFRNLVVPAGGRCRRPWRWVPTDVGVLMYTGGTTGVSKGAMLTHPTWW